GLFIGYALLLLLAALSVSKLASAAPQWKRELYWSIMAALILGPISFWVWDDPIYGWHGELLFLPLSILFCTALISQSQLRWVFAALIVLTREEGAVVAWAIHILHEFTRTASLSRKYTPSRRDILSLVKITAGWFVVFVAGIVLLRLMHTSGGQ